MPRRKALKRPATSEAMQGNQNAVKSEEEKIPHPTTLSLSLTSRRKERIRAAMEWHDGSMPEDDEVERKARELAYLAWDEYARSIERHQERAIIL